MNDDIVWRDYFGNPYHDTLKCHCQLCAKYENHTSQTFLIATLEYICRLPPLPNQICHIPYDEVHGPHWNPRKCPYCHISAGYPYNQCNQKGCHARKHLLAAGKAEP